MLSPADPVQVVAAAEVVEGALHFRGQKSMWVGWFVITTGSR